MADAKKDEFLDDIEAAEAEMFEDEQIDITEEAAEEDELAAVTAERDEYKDRFMRALAEAKIPQAQRTRPARGRTIWRIKAVP